MIFIIFLIVFLLSFVLFAIVNVYERIKMKEYVQRKTDDQRKFNVIREKIWWK